MNVQSLGTFWSDPSRVFSWEQNKVFLTNVTSAGKWPYLFVGWDSAWYLSIMTRGYAFSGDSYTFSPGLPFFGNLFNLALGNPLVSITVCALVFGVLWIPLYQLLAEKYMSKQAALASTLLFAFSPYLFLFTTVAYSESAFLFFTLGAWYLFNKGKVAYASAFGIVAILTRTFGILIVLPMLFGSLKQKGLHRLRNVILSLLPAVALAIWFIYISFIANNFLAPVRTTEWSGLYSFRTLLMDLPHRGIDAILMAPYQHWPTPPHWLLPSAIILALAIPPLLIYKVAKMDKSLAIYSLAGYIGILVFAALVSTPRFISVLFPLWIPLTAKLSGSRKSMVLVAVVAAVFYVVAVSLWMDFLNGQFIA
jgi:hypothetical protein